MSLTDESLPEDTWWSHVNPSNNWNFHRKSNFMPFFSDCVISVSSYPGLVLLFFFLSLDFMEDKFLF